MENKKLEILEKITIVKGDITEQKVDAIVNSANESLKVSCYEWTIKIKKKIEKSDNVYALKIVNLSK